MKIAEVVTDIETTNFCIARCLSFVFYFANELHIYNITHFEKWQPDSNLRELHVKMHHEMFHPNFHACITRAFLCNSQDHMTSLSTTVVLVLYWF